MLIRAILQFSGLSQLGVMITDNDILILIDPSLDMQLVSLYPTVSERRL